MLDQPNGWYSAKYTGNMKRAIVNWIRNVASNVNLYDIPMAATNNGYTVGVTFIVIHDVTFLRFCSVVFGIATWLQFGAEIANTFLYIFSLHPILLGTPVSCCHVIKETCNTLWETCIHRKVQCPTYWLFVIYDAALVYSIIHKVFIWFCSCFFIMIYCIS